MPRSAHSKQVHVDTAPYSKPKPEKKLSYEDAICPRSVYRALDLHMEPAIRRLKDTTKTFLARSECLRDVVLVSERLGTAVQEYNRLHPKTPLRYFVLGLQADPLTIDTTIHITGEYVWYFASNLDLATLRLFIDGIKDCHVIAQTVAPTFQYTGDRDFDFFLVEDAEKAPNDYSLYTKESLALAHQLANQLLTYSTLQPADDHKEVKIPSDSTPLPDANKS